MSSLFSARGRVVALLVIAASFAAVPAANAASSARPGENYVAVGDSLAFGYQGNTIAACAATGCANPDALFRTGYVDDFAAAMRTRPGHNPEKVANFGCPGETSSTLLNATNATTGCTTYPFPLHRNHPGTTQIAAAVAYLKKAGDDVNTITFDIGANDLLGTIRTCNNDPVCIQGAAPAVIGAVAQNTAIALGKLRAAAPKAKIIVLGLYNPAFTLPGGDYLTDSVFNPTIAGVAASFGALFANPFQTINHGAAYPNEAASVCSQINICAAGDVHPFDNGYQAIADVIFGVSGF
jgi:lysophospholipase L1-like esterase